MSRYVKQVIHRTKFDGDDVTVTLEPFRYADLLQLDGLVVAGTKDSEVLNLYSKMLPAYIAKVEGLRDAAGVEMTGADICNSVYFSALLVDIGNALVNAAKLADPRLPASLSVAS